MKGWSALSHLGGMTELSEAQPVMAAIEQRFQVQSPHSPVRPSPSRCFRTSLRPSPPDPVTTCPGLPSHPMPPTSHIPGHLPGVRWQESAPFLESLGCQPLLWNHIKGPCTQRRSQRPLRPGASRGSGPTPGCAHAQRRAAQGQEQDHWWKVRRQGCPSRQPPVTARRW